MKAWVIAASMIVATPAAAHKYSVIAVERDTGVLALLDLDSLHEAAGFKRAWLLTVLDNEPPRKATYLQTLMEFDCKSEKSRMLIAKLYEQDGTPVRDRGATDWTFPGPGTGEERALRLGCGPNPDPESVVDMSREDIVAGFVASMSEKRKGKQ